MALSPTAPSPESQEPVDQTPEELRPDLSELGEDSSPEQPGSAASLQSAPPAEQPVTDTPASQPGPWDPLRERLSTLPLEQQRFAEHLQSRYRDPFDAALDLRRFQQEKDRLETELRQARMATPSQPPQRQVPDNRAERMEELADAYLDSGQAADEAQARRMARQFLRQEQQRSASEAPNAAVQETVGRLEAQISGLMEAFAHPEFATALRSQDPTIAEIVQRNPNLSASEIREVWEAKQVLQGRNGHAAPIPGQQPPLPPTQEQVAAHRAQVASQTAPAARMRSAPVASSDVAASRESWGALYDKNAMSYKKAFGSKDNYIRAMMGGGR